MRKPLQRGHAVQRAILLLGVAALLTACPRTAKKPEPPSAPPVALQEGEWVTAPVVPDGQWRPTGIYVRAGDRISFEPVGAAKGLAPEAIQVHIGRSMTQQVYPSAPQRVSRTGEIVFRVDPTLMGPYDEKTVDIRIRSHRKE